jgi:uncharacterized membrane protein
VWLGVVLIACFVAVLTLLAVEVRHWQTGRRIIGRRRFIIRLLGGGLLLALLAAIFLGLYVFQLAEPTRRGAALWLAYWGGCILAAFFLMTIAIADAREVETRFGEGEKELWKDLLRWVMRRSKEGETESRE